MKDKPAVRDQKVESLHQEAAGHYLQGDYPRALAAWRELLKIFPEDPQAIEGIRLCEQLTGSSAEDVASARLVQPPADEAMPFDELVDLCSELESSAPAAAPVATPLSDSLKDSLEELDRELDAAGGSSPRPAASGGADEDFVELTSYSTGASAVPDKARAGGSKPESPEAIEAAAAAELRHRVNELLAGALAAMEQGDRNEALSMLARVAILDEDNEAARSLQQMIRQEIEAEVASTPTAAAEIEAVELPDDEAPRTDPPLPPEALAAADDGAEPQAEDAEPQPASAARMPWPARLPSRPWMLGAAGVLLALVLGFVGWQHLGAGRPADDPTGSAAQLGSADDADTGSAPEGRAAGTARVGAVKPAAAHRGPKLAAALDRARVADAAGDYAAAVLAYNEALELDPASVETRQQLKVAGERYREQREIKQRWQEVEGAFRSGDYRRALQVLYRMPQGQGQAQIQRYIRNGWFNLGLTALRSNDCPQALEHLREAASAGGQDPGVQDALRLAQGCEVERAKDSFIVAVDGLKLRAMQD